MSWSRLARQLLSRWFWMDAFFKFIFNYTLTLLNENIIYLFLKTY